MKICPSCLREYPDHEEFCASDGMKLRPKNAGQSSDPLIGTTLDDRWVIESKIGEGGMGSVYRAHQKSVDRPVAVKTLRTQIEASDEYANRFFREAQVAAKISHPHCVTIHDFNQERDTGILYLVMEYLEGEPLTDRIERSDLTIGEIVEVSVQIASALAAAHEHQIVHRDLKPDNIFLLAVAGGGSFVKVLDFGIAKMLEGQTQMTRTGMVLGTPMYMSPEQCDGRAVDLRSDLYSLGCIIYEMLGGRAPFVEATPMSVLFAHVSKAPKRLRELGLGVPDELEAVVMRLLEKEPDARFQTALELRDALQDALAGMTSAQRAARVQKVAVEEAWVFDETAHGAAAVDASVDPNAGTAAMGAAGTAATVAATPEGIPPREPAQSAPTAPSPLSASSGVSTKTLGIIGAALLLLILGLGGLVAMNLVGDDGDETVAVTTPVVVEPAVVEAPAPAPVAEEEPVAEAKPAAEAKPVEAAKPEKPKKTKKTKKKRSTSAKKASKPKAEEAAVAEVSTEKATSAPKKTVEPKKVEPTKRDPRKTVPAKDEKVAGAENEDEPNSPFGGIKKGTEKINRGLDKTNQEIRKGRKKVDSVLKGLGL